MTTLSERPNTALLVNDVQTGVVAGTHDRERVIENIDILVERARAHDVPGGLDPGLGRPRPRHRPVADRPRAAPPGRRTTRPQALRRLLRRHGGRGGSCRAPCRTPRRHRGASRHVRPLHTSRGVRPWIRRDTRRRRTHDRGPLLIRCSPTRVGHRAHEPVLGRRGCPRPTRTDGRRRVPSISSPRRWPRRRGTATSSKLLPDRDVRLAVRGERLPRPVSPSLAQRHT